MNSQSRFVMRQVPSHEHSATQRGAKARPTPSPCDDAPTDLSEHQAFAVELGRKMRASRVAKGLSLQSVEKMTGGGFKASVLGAYERGQRMISVLRLQLLSEAYRVDVEELLPPSAERASWEYRLDMPNGDELLTVGPGWVRADEPERGHVPLRLVLATRASTRSKLLMVADHVNMLGALVAKLDEGTSLGLSGAQRTQLSNVLISSAAELSETIRGTALSSDWALRAEQALYLQALTAISEAVSAASRHLPQVERADNLT